MALHCASRKANDVRSQFDDACGRMQTFFDDLVAQLESLQEEKSNLASELDALKVQYHRLQSAQLTSCIGVTALWP